MSIWTEGAVWRIALQTLIRDIDTCAGDGGEKQLLFLTFELDIELLEQHVLGWLANSGEATGPLRNPANKKPVEDWLKSVQTTVVHDASGLKGTAKRTSVVTAPARTEYGVFHPKIVLYANGPEVGLQVGSANLTRSGIGSNIESLGLLTTSDRGQSIVRGPRLRQEIQAFLKELAPLIDARSTVARDRVNRMIETLGSRYTDKAADDWSHVRFLWNTPYARSQSTEHLKTILAKANDLYYWSPFFPLDAAPPSSLPLPLEGLRRSKSLEDEPLYVCAAASRHDPAKRYLGKGFYQKVLDTFGGHAWQDFRPFLDSGRFAHAKLARIGVGKDAYVLIGSHNLTDAAWGTWDGSPKNVEASLLLKVPERAHTKDERPDGDLFRRMSSSFEVDEEIGEADVDERMPDISVVVDWETSQAEIAFSEPHGGPHRWSLTTPWSVNGQCTRRIDPQGPGAEPLVERNLDLGPVVRNATFQLARETDGHRWVGIVCERNPNLRPSGFTSLDELLESLSDGVEHPPDPPSPPWPGNGGNGYPRPPDRPLEPPGEQDAFVLWYDLFGSLRALADRVTADEDGRWLLEATVLLEREAAGPDVGDSLDDKRLVRLWLLARELAAMAGELPCAQRLTTIRSAMGQRLQGRCADWPLLSQWVDRVYVKAETLHEAITREGGE